MDYLNAKADGNLSGARKAMDKIVTYYDANIDKEWSGDENQKAYFKVTMEHYMDLRNAERSLTLKVGPGEKNNEQINIQGVIRNYTPIVTSKDSTELIEDFGIKDFDEKIKDLNDLIRLAKDHNLKDVLEGLKGERKLLRSEKKKKEKLSELEILAKYMDVSLETLLQEIESSKKQKRSVGRPFHPLYGN